MKVAYFLRSLDLVFSQEKTYEIYAICLEGSEEMRIAQTELRLTNIIPIKLKKKGINFSELKGEDVFKNSNLSPQLKKYQINCLFLRNSTKFLKEWSKESGIAILSPSYQLAEKFEDKLFFDSFLKKIKIPSVKSAILRSKKALLPFLQTVVQIPKSTGGEGTFFADSEKSFQKILKTLNLPLLAREYQKGMACGASLFVDQENVCLSALNRQCFLKNPNGGPLGLFIGIQWLPSQFFTKELYEKITRDLIRIAEKIKQEGLTGMFNLDFILSENDQIFFLECNPRITAATPQIIATEELHGRTDFMRLLLNHFCQKNYPAAKPDSLPENSFQGAQMCIELPEHTITKLIPGGFFELKKGKIKRIGLENRLDFLKLKNGLFFHNEINEGENYKKTITAGTVFTNFPMYDMKAGFLNKNGKIVYDFFHSIKKS
ncbi:MAG: ATP-grasp domain-containing protein [Candidatus Nealsonbacteria bacterium]